MPDTSVNLALPYLAASQAQKHVTHNEALQILDAVVQLSVVSRGVTTPPAAPDEGERHIVPAAATGAWSGQEGHVALWNGTAWVYLAPQTGWRAWVEDEAAEVHWQGGAWALTPGVHNVTELGVNTAADTVNRLAVASEATLLTHDGAGHQLKINKSAAGETASLLFQSGWSGRAEMGLAGSDGWSLKVSDDGTSWTEALAVDPASGHVSGAAVQASAADVTPGRLARADYAYSPGNLLGAVSETGGVPAGAVIERGSNANGDYLRLADGTQICWHYLDMGAVTAYGSGSYGDPYRTGLVDWTFPASFIDGSYVPLGNARLASPSTSGARSAVGLHGAFGRFTSYLNNIQVVRHSSDSNADTVVALVAAIGRWF